MRSTLSFFAAAVSACALSSAAWAQTVCTQLVDNTVLTGAGGVACVTPAPNQFNAGTQFLRRYRFPTTCNPPVGSEVTSVDIGHAQALAGGGALSQPAEVRLYTAVPGGPDTYASYTQVRSENILINDGTNVIVNVPLSSPLPVSSFAGLDLVVELRIPDGVAAGNRFFPGINVAGETASSFIASTSCGIADPIAVASLGFPQDFYLLDLRFTSTPPPVVYCTSGTSTAGCSPQISASAQPSVAAVTPCTISVSGAEGQRQGLVFYGLDNSGFTPLQWSTTSTSFLCIKSPTQRTPPASSGGTAGQCDGAYSLDWNNFQATFVAIGQPWGVGDKVYAQVWYRDPPASKTTNLSNAVEMTYVP